MKWFFGGNSHLQSSIRDEPELSDDDKVHAAEVERYKSKRGGRRHTWAILLNNSEKGRQRKD